MTDVTDNCVQGHHNRCCGTLHAGKGFHWWCACDCHPAPPSTASATAQAVWRTARASNIKETPDD